MVIVWEKGSGLCNRLFISAYGISVAQAAGQRLINLRLDRHEDFFPATKKWAFFGSVRFGIYKIIRSIIHRLKRLPFMQGCFVKFAFNGENSASCSPGNPQFIEEVRSRRFTFIEGWPHLEKMTFPATEAIRDTFTPSEEVMNEVAAFVRRAKSDADLLVGVHIRRGDYLNHLDGKYNYSTEFYREVMARTKELLAPKKVAFLVCSDAKQEPKDFQPIGVILGPGTILGDLYSLAACDYSIGPPSTFSLWAAFYGRTPFYCLMTAHVPSTLSDFVVPNGHFECMETVMDTECR